MTEDDAITRAFQAIKKNLGDLSHEVTGLRAIADNWETLYRREKARRVDKEVSTPDPHTTEEKKEAIEDWAGLVYQIGSIIEDRRELGEDTGPVWDYLWEHMDGIYGEVGPIIDRVEEAVFGGPVGAA